MLLAAVIHGSWLTLVLAHEAIPTAITIVLLGFVVAWHGSLQHEVLHHHPFRSQRINDLVGSAPLALRLPYPLYKRDHLAHHEARGLTETDLDTESFYIDAERWAAGSRVTRSIALLHHCLLGRLLIGPLVMNVAIVRSQLREARAGNRQVIRWWVGHAVAVAMLLWFVTGVAGMPAWVYVVGAGYFGHSIGLIRSYCEHRWVEGDVSLSAVVRSGPFFSLLFLNNNLHHAHHARPGAPWYMLPEIAGALRSDDAARAGAGYYRGYREVFLRYLFRPFDHPVHPLERARAGVTAR